MGKIYKYLGYDVLRLALSEEGLCSFRCSYPREFNDPYELFLTLDFQKQQPELLAYYHDVIGDLPQYPVTCFSKAPDVIPMWAHYGRSHRGVVLEFDENEFSKHFTDARFGDVDYQNEPDESLEAILSRAFHIGKPRYHYFLLEGVLSAAYFTKQLCWEYEKERRLVLPEKDIEKVGEMMLVKFPTSCITSDISGRNSSDDDKEFGKRAADDIGAPYYELNIGRSSGQPYFIGTEERTCTFADGSILATPFTCESCKEPVPDEEEVCSWCRIEEEHEVDAASRNALRILDHFGLLEEWSEAMRGVGNKTWPVI